VTPWTVARQAPWLWNSPGKITGVSCYVLLQEILPTQGSNPRLLHLLHWQGGSLAPSGKPKSQASLSVEFSRQEYWSFSFSIIPSKEIPGLISFRTDWLDLLAVQGTLKSLLQHHSSKASILWRSAFFTVQLSHPYMTIGKTIAFVGKVMSLLFNRKLLFQRSFFL